MSKPKYSYIIHITVSLGSVIVWPAKSNRRSWSTVFHAPLHSQLFWSNYSISPSTEQWAKESRLCYLVCCVCECVYIRTGTQKPERGSNWNRLFHWGRAGVWPEHHIGLSSFLFYLVGRERGFDCFSAEFCDKLMPFCTLKMCLKVAVCWRGNSLKIKWVNKWQQHDKRTLLLKGSLSLYTSLFFGLFMSFT